MFSSTIRFAIGVSATYVAYTDGLDELFP
jgi:hypothetical protein